MSATDSGGDSDSAVLKFDLYIKASAIDKETKGSCPICQQFFMMTFLLGENQEGIDFKVFTVQADNPPKNFASGWSKKYPVVMVNSGTSKFGDDLSGCMYDTFEELEQFFESINRECPELKNKNAPNLSAMKVVADLYKHFNHFIAGQPEKGLLSELKKLNEYLESQDTKFLVDNILSFADCHLLPRLQHIRVAGKAYRAFDIPKEFPYIWRYLKHAYEQEAFKSTIPSDQDIVFNYEKKAGGPPRAKGRHALKPTLEKFTYTTDVPEDILNGLDNGVGLQQQQAEEILEQEPARESYSKPLFQPETEPHVYQEPEPTHEPDSEPDFAVAVPVYECPDNGELDVPPAQIELLEEHHHKEIEDHAHHHKGVEDDEHHHKGIEDEHHHKENEDHEHHHKGKDDHEHHHKGIEDHEHHHKGTEDHEHHHKKEDDEHHHKGIEDHEHHHKKEEDEHHHKKEDDEHHHKGIDDHEHHHENEDNEHHHKEKGDEEPAQVKED